MSPALSAHLGTIGTCQLARNAPIADASKTTPALFIPLAARWFDAFAAGTKTREYRRYGARWNERTCQVGRPVTLSRGYGRQRRLAGVIAGFRIVGPDEHPDIRAVYPDADRIAEIEVKL